MPRRKDISKILIIGSGPIVIGQSAEFDYSGAQACKALKAEGFEVVLVNSNPATIMTALTSSLSRASTSRKSFARKSHWEWAGASRCCPQSADRQH
jgi:hypothetical protein